MNQLGGKMEFGWHTESKKQKKLHNRKEEVAYLIRKHTGKANSHIVIIS